MRSIWTIVTNPRMGVRELIGESKLIHFLALASVYGVARNLQIVFKHGIPHDPAVSKYEVLIPNIGFGIPFGIATLYVFAFLLAWVGKLFRGKARASEVRYVLAWSQLPQCPLLLMLLVALVLGPADMFARVANSGPLGRQSSEYLVTFNMIYFVPGLVLGIWAAYIAVVGLSEAHGIGVGRTILVFLVALVLFMVPMTFVMKYFGASLY